jgi:hypothetical protein
MVRCGVFCERCGDCLACYGDDPCYDDGPHSWPAEAYEPDEPGEDETAPTIEP